MRSGWPARKAPPGVVGPVSGNGERANGRARWDNLIARTPVFGSRVRGVTAVKRLSGNDDATCVPRPAAAVT